MAEDKFDDLKAVEDDADTEEEDSQAGSDDDEDDEFESGSESESESEEEEDTGLTDNQNRALYMVSLYTHRAENQDDREEWIRKQALMVLIYEGVVSQVLDYDYAPQSDLVENRRKYFNISQEGKSDVDFLREEELINGLKLSSKSYQPVTCYQISEKGQEIVKKLSRKEKEAVHEMVYAPGTRELLRVEWDGEEYWLKTESGFERMSTVTDTEDVSYVSSAYVPQCLRHGGRPTLSNAHRAHECGSTTSNIRDELDEVITLNSVSVIVSEYIPFGSNQVVAMNDSLGSTERVQGGFYTALVDDDAAGTQLDMAPGLTSVNILDYSLTNHVNFEADIHFPEAPGIVQVETFGCSMNAEGTCFYGMQIEAVLDRIKDNISLDHLARLLVDVHMDSSKIVDSVISSYQRELLELIFMGDAENRDKVNLIIANEITPHLTAEEYMDKGEYENELKQVLGDTRAAFDISEHDTLIFGAYGVLVAGPNSRHHEPLLCAYLQFVSMDIFVRNYFSRMFIVGDAMKTTQHKIEENEKDPNSIHKIRAMISKISKEIILMEEILGYLAEALDTIFVPPEPPEQAGRALYERLQIHDLKGQVSRRVKDLQKNMNGAQHDLEVLREMSLIVSETRAYNLNASINYNTRNLCQLQEANDRAASSLEIMQVVLAGSLSFDILDRITGDWTVINTEWMRAFVEPMLKTTPAIWFIFNMAFWFLLGFALIKFMRWLNWRSQGVITLRMRMMKKINVENLSKFLHVKNISQEDRDYDKVTDIVQVVFEADDKRDWGGARPVITLEYEELNGYMLNMTLAYNRRHAKKNLVFNARELKAKLMDELKAAEVFEEELGDKDDPTAADDMDEDDEDDEDEEG